MRFYGRTAVFAATITLFLGTAAAAYATPITVPPDTRTVAPGPYTTLPTTNHAAVAIDTEHDAVVAQNIGNGMVDVRRISRATGAVVGSVQFAPDPTASSVFVTGVAAISNSNDTWVAIGAEHLNPSRLDGWFVHINSNATGVVQLVHVPGFYPVGLTFNQGLYLVADGIGVGTVAGTALDGASAIAFDPATGTPHWATDVNLNAHYGSDTTFSQVSNLGRDVVFTHTDSRGVVLSELDGINGTLRPYDFVLGPSSENAIGVAVYGNNVFVQHGAFVDTLQPVAIASGWTRTANCDTGVPFWMAPIAGGPEGAIIPADANTVRGLDGKCAVRWSGTSGSTSMVATGIAYDGTAWVAGGGRISSFQPYTLPSAPFPAHATPGDGHAVISWVAPASTGDTPLTNYEVVVNGVDYSVPLGVYSRDITGLTNGTTYTVNVYAVNQYGAGSPATTTVTPAAPTVPSAPTNLHATVSDGDSHVSWDPPASDGGSPIIGFTITIDDAIAIEGSRTAVATVHLNHVSSSTVTVHWSMKAATASRRDFTATTGTLTFAPGQTTATIPLKTRIDHRTEGAEKFSVLLSKPTGGAIIGDGTGIVTIPANNT